MNAFALEDGHRSWSGEALHDEVERLAGLLRASRVQVLATLLDNSAAWVVADLAAASTGVVHLPLPTFFTVTTLPTAVPGTTLSMPSSGHGWPSSVAEAIR